MSEYQSMPIMNREKYSPCPSHIPFALLCETQAQMNHSQSLARLRERGGLSPVECLAVMEQLEWKDIASLPEHEAARLLTKRVLECAERDQLQARCEGLEAEKGKVYQALLNAREERDQAQKEVNKWKERAEKTANFNPDWDQLEATQESLREHMKLLRDYRQELARSETENAQQQERIAEQAEVVKAVAHIGVDFGYGKYELEDRIIDLARKLYEQPTPQPEEESE